MIKIKLSRAIQLPNATKTILRPGIHNIPDDVYSHWFIQGMVASGEIVVMDDVTSAQPTFVRQKAVENVAKPPAFVNPAPQPFVVEEVKPTEEVKVVVEEILPTEASEQPVPSTDDGKAIEESKKEVKKIRRRKKA